MIAQIVATLLRLWGPTVDEANAAAAVTLPDRPQCHVPLRWQPYDCPRRTRWALSAIADRESPGHHAAHFKWVGVARMDSIHQDVLWRRGHRRGRQGFDQGALRWWCPAHSDPEGMSTVGPHGLMYVYNIHRLGVPGNCLPWWIFAAPAVSALAARHRYLQYCDAVPPRRWCPTVVAMERARRRRCRRGEVPREDCKEVPSG